jgi:hypothetical protein
MIAHVQETEMFVPTALKNKKEILNFNMKHFNIKQ